MSTTKPLVSVILPVYNGAQFLAKAVGNIRCQNFCPLEAIIDDGTTDDTAELAASLEQEIRYIWCVS